MSRGGWAHHFDENWCDPEQQRRLVALLEAAEEIRSGREAYLLFTTSVFLVQGANPAALCALHSPWQTEDLHHFPRAEAQRLIQSSPDVILREVFGVECLTYARKPGEARPEEPRLGSERGSSE